MLEPDQTLSQPLRPSRPIRVVLAKGGLDAHERGVLALALGLRSVGFEVIYLGLRRTPAEVVAAAIQEGADVVGVSTLSGGHRAFVARIIHLLAEANASPLVVLGGLIPSEEQDKLLKGGVARIFGQGALIGDIAKYLVDAVEQKRRETEFR